MAALCWSTHEEIPHAQGKRNPSKMVGVARGHQRADTLKQYSQKTSQSNHTRTTALSNSMKLSHARGAAQDGRLMVERSDRLWTTGEGNGKPLQYSCLENPLNSMKRQNDRILKEKLPGSVGAQYATGDQWRNNSRKNEGMEPKQKQYPAVDVTGDRSKVRCYKEQYCIGTWNVRSMNQGKLEVVKQEMARVNVDILGISELKWTGTGEFNSGDHYIYYCRQESLRRNGVAIVVNKKVQNAVLGCNLKNDRMISVRFQGISFNIMVIQVYPPTSNVEEAEVEWFYKNV